MQIDGSLRSLLQGVSKQHRRDRLDGQCTAQLNMVADPVRNLVRRPASAAIASLGSSTADTKFHLHDAGDEQYIVQLSRTEGSPDTADVQVFDLAGVAQTVTIGSGSPKNYLIAASDMKSDLSCTTIGDYTIIANSTVATAFTSDVSTNVDGVVIQVTQGNVYGKDYRILIDGTEAAKYITPGSGANDLGTTEIVEALVTDFKLDPRWDGLGGDYAIESTGSYIFISWSALPAIPKTGAMDISTSDDDDDASMTVTQYTTQKVAELPRVCFRNKIVRVIGADKSGQDDYYLRYDRAAGSSLSTIGTWVESIGPDLQYKLDSTTMPHALIRTSPGKFYFGSLNGATSDGVTIESWVERDAGDDDSNPAHGFLGRGIAYVTQFQNRLVLLAGEYCSLSKTNSFFNFFNRSGVAAVDTDPIELTTPTAEYTTFRSAVQHNRHLVIFSDNAQFVIKGLTKVTPGNASLSLATAFTTTLQQAVPISVGGSVLFPYKFGNFAGLRDFVSGASADQNIADSITDHVRTYIPGGAVSLIGSANLGMAFVRSNLNPERLYLYQFMWSGAQRVQSAWSTWEFPYPIHANYIVANMMYLVMKRGNEFILSSMDLGDEPRYTFGFNIYADLLQERTVTNKVLTYAHASGLTADDLLVTVADGEPYEGASLQIESVVGTTVTLKQHSPKVNIGVRYTSSYTPTMPMVRDKNEAKISTDTLVLFWFLVSVVDSYEFDTLVSSPYRDTTVQRTRTARTGISLVGSTGMASGTFQVSVLDDADIVSVEFSTDGPYPLNIVDLEYRGQFQKRGYRV